MKHGNLNQVGLFLGSVSILAFMPWSAAQAQDASPVAADQQAEAAPPAGETDDIVVTANKREQSINKVGLAITAISGDALRNQRVVTLSDLANTIPGLSFTPSATQTPVYTLRGVGFYETSLAAYPTTSVYVDQVPLPFPALTTHANFDLERVEVLKGPQGTLFGQNSTGGAINFIAAKPTAAFAAGGDITYGRFNRLEANAYISGPLSDTVKARLALTGARADDWQYSYTRKDKLGEVGYYGARLLVDWEASDRLDFEVNLNGWRDQSDPQAPQYQTLLSQSPATTVPALRAFPFAPFKSRAADWTPSTRPHADNRLLQGSVRMNWEVTDSATITAITSYVDYKPDQGFETDGTPLMVDDFVVDRGRIKSFSQELRIANSDRSQFRWVVGANYEKSDVYEYQVQTFPDISTAPIFGYTGDYTYSDQHMKNYALFANGEFDVSEQLTVKAGARYTWADRRAALCTGDAGDNSFGSVFTSLANAIQQGFVTVPGFTPAGVVVPDVGQGCAALDNVTSDGTPITYFPGQFKAKLDEKNLSWRVGADYKITSTTLVYVNLAKGYKAGSFPIASAATFEQYAGVTQESLLSYEAGLKAQAFDRALSIDASVFYYDYKNKQLRSKLVDPIFGVLDSLQNIPKSRLYGAELNFVARPVEGLTLNVGGSYIKTKITEFTGFSSSGGLTNFKGSEIPFTPKYQLRVAGDYQWNMGSVAPFVGFAVSARSKAAANIGGTKGLVAPADFASSVPFDSVYNIPGYTILDLQAGLSFDDSRYRVTVFGKNVLNKYYVTNIYTDYDTVNRYTGMPATYGVTLAFKFR